MSRSIRRTALFLMLLPLLAAPLAAASQWVPLGPFGGTIAQLAVDPVDSRVVYATTATSPWEGSLFKTTDGGGHWSQIHSEVGDLAVDLLRHDTLYIVDRGGSHPGRIMKSVNGGVSWAAMGSGNVYGTCVAVDPAQPSLVYAAGGTGVWRSTDRGASWTLATPLPSDAKRLVASGQASGTVFAITWGGVYKSADAGRTWSLVHLPYDSDIRELGVFAAASQRLYATLENDLYRSTDGGATWQQALRRTIGGSPISLTVFARSPRTLWLGTSSGLLRSTDAGDTWSAIGPGQPVTTLAIAASSPRTLYAGLQESGTDAGGLFASTDGGGTWTRRNHGLTGLDMSAMALDPGNPGVLWVANAGGLYRSTNAGAAWKRIALAPNPPSQALPFYGVVVDPVTPSTVYVLSSALWRTQDAGSSWTNLSATGAPALRLLLINPQNPRHLWGIADGWLYKSTDAGAHWSRLKLPTTFHCGIYGFAVAPTSPPTLYLSGGEGDLEDICWDWAYPVFFRSTDGGATWTDLSKVFRYAPFDSPGPIALDPVDPRRLYIGTDAQYKFSGCGGVWKSGDGGTTWGPAGRDLGCVYAVAASPAAGVVWASTDDARIFRSGDFGDTWKRRTTSLLTAHIYDLMISPADPQRVYATTSTGVWVWDESP